MADPTSNAPVTDPDGLVHVVSPLGEIERVRPEDVPELQRGGTRLATGGEVSARLEKDQYSDFGHMVEAGGLGLLRGASLGLSDVALNALGQREAVEKIQKYNPMSSVLGEAAGAVGAGLLSGGESLAARVVSAPTRAVTALGEAAGGLTARTLGEGVIASGVRAATEGALYGAGSAVSEAAIQRDGFDHIGELLANSVGLNALMGGGLGAGLSLLGRGAGALGGAARERLAAALAEPTAEGLENVAAGTFGARAPGVGGMIRDALARGADLAGAIPAGVGREGFRDLLESNAAHIATHADEILAAETDRLTGSLQRVHETQQKMAEQFIGEAKLQNVERLLGNADRAEAGKQLGLALDDSFASLSKIATDPELSSKGFKLRELAETFDHAKELIERHVADGTDEGLAKAYMALDDLKRSAGKRAYAFGSNWDGLTRAQRGTWGELTQMYEKLRGSLEHEAWGAAGVAQREINAPWAELISGERAAGSNSFGSQFIEKTPGYFGRDVKRVSKAKVASFLDTLTNPAESERWKGLTTYMDSADRFTKAIGDHVALTPGQAKQLATFRAAAEEARASMSTAGEAALRRNQLKALGGAAGGSFASSLVAGALGHLGGPIGAGIGLVGTGLSILRDPARIVRTLAAIDDLVGRGASRAARSTAAIARRGAPMPSFALRGAGVAVETHQRLSAARAEFERRRVAQERLAQTPAAISTAAASAFADIAPHAPQVTAAASTALANTVQYLNAIMPKLGFPGQPGVTVQPSKAEIRSTNARARAAEDPNQLADELRRGAVSPLTIEAVQQAAPALFRSMQGNVVTMLSDQAQDGRQPSYEDRLRLSMTFGLPIEPMADQALMQDMQSAYVPQQPAPKQAEPQAADSFKRATKAAETATDRLVSAA